MSNRHQPLKEDIDAAQTGFDSSRVFSSIALLALTTVLFLWNAKLIPEYSPVQSVGVFRPQHLFATAFYLWAFLLVLLISRTRRLEWLSLIFVWLFVLVFVGSWTRLTRATYSELFPQVYALVHYLPVRNGLYPPHYAIQEFPGLRNLTLGTIEVTGLEVLKAVLAVVVLTVLAFTTILFSTFRHWSNGESGLAAEGLFLVIAGSLVLTATLTTFHPRLLATTLLVSQLALLSKHSRSHSSSSIVLALLLQWGLLMTHLVTAIVSMLLLFVSAVHRSGRRGLALGTVFVVLCLGWIIQVNHIALGDVVRVAVPFLARLIGAEPPDYLAEMRAPFLTLTPWWANATLFLWTLILGPIGFIVSAYLLLKGRREVWLSGVIVALISAFLFAFSGLVSDVFWRVLAFLPFFTIPVLLGFGTPHSTRYRYGPQVLAALFVVLSLPSFFADNPNVAMDTYYPADLLRAALMEEHLPRNVPLHIVTTERDAHLLQAHLPNADIDYLYRPNLATTREAMFSGVETLIVERDNGATSLSFVAWADVRWIHLFRSAIALDPTGADQWMQIQSALQNRARIADNGFSQLYARSAQLGGP